MWNLELFRQEGEIEKIEDDLKAQEKEKDRIINTHKDELIRIHKEYLSEMNRIQEEHKQEKQKTENLIKKNSQKITEYKINKEKKDKLIEMEKHLMAKLKFERTYIENERLKFCEDKLIQEREMGEIIKENFKIENEIHSINKKIKDENRSYHNTYIKKQNKLTDMLTNLKKLENRKRNLCLDTHLYDLEQQFVGKMLKNQNNKIKKNTLLLRKLQNEINIKQVDFMKEKEELEKEIAEIDKESQAVINELMNKKHKVLKVLSNTEFIARIIWLQRQRLVEFFRHAGEYYENAISQEKIQLKSRRLEEEEHSQRIEKLDQLETENEYLKIFKAKLRL